MYLFSEEVKMQEWGRVCFQGGGRRMVDVSCRITIKKSNLLTHFTPIFHL